MLSTQNYPFFFPYGGVVGLTQPDSGSRALHSKNFTAAFLLTDESSRLSRAQCVFWYVQNEKHEVGMSSRWLVTLVELDK